ncbi:MAG: ABC transporter permease, partial [Saprospiraceae bacterium]
MFQNYLKIAWRNLVKNKAFSTINILGLAIGLCSFMIIMLWISHELSFDNFHSNKNQLYRVMINGKDSNTGEKYTSIATPLALANALRDDVPGIKAVCESNWEGKQYLKAGENSLSKYGTEVSNEFFSLFKFRFVQGDSKTALANPESIVLTEQTAIALFGKDDPMNKIVRWNNIVDLMVTGIVQDIPTNSYFKNFQYFMPFSNYEKRQSWVAQARNDWGNFSFNMFVELEPNVTYAQIEPKIRNLIINHKEKDTHQVMLFPIAKWRLYNEFRNWDSTAGRIDYVKMFGLVGIIILLIACINFMNLSTARSEKRAREVGVRKSIGSSRLQLIAQFLGESILLSSLSFLVSILLITLILPLFNNLLETNISLPFTNSIFWLFSLGAILFTGVLAGSYPAFYLSSFQAIKVLKGQIANNKSATLPRKFLVVTQFVASLALIMSTMIIYQQLQFAQTRPSGYHPNGLLLVDMKSDLQKNYNVVKNELENSGVIESVVKASAPIHSIWSNWLVTDFTGKIGDEKASVAYIATVPNYFSTLGIKFKQGRDFYSESDSSSIIINEATVERLRLQDPIGKTIKL